MKSLFQFRKNPLFLTLYPFLLLISAAFFFVIPINMAKMQNKCTSDICDKPITKQKILDVLTQAKNSTVKEKNDTLICAINYCNIDFGMTDEIEKELLDNKASKKLIEVIRKKQEENQNLLPGKLSTSLPTSLELNQIKFVEIPRGKFSMGSTKTFSNELHWTMPIKDVEVKENFWMSEHEITIGEWRRVMSKIPSQLEKANSKFKDDNHPIIYVSWEDTQNFIKKLNEKSVEYKYSLPTEAEWEYAARAETKTEFFFGDNLNKLQANFEGTGTKTVCYYPRNKWGLCDMHGNVKEWVKDIFSPDYKWREPFHGTWGNVLGDENLKSIRGGSWQDISIKCRSASRTFFDMKMAGDSLGFRIVAKRLDLGR